MKQEKKFSVLKTRKETRKMKLTYIYHSGFAIEANGFSILMDYFKDTLKSSDMGFVHQELLNRPGTLYILASHFHPDHFNAEVLQWKKQKKDIVYIFSKDILKRKRAGKEEAIYLKKGDCFEDKNLRIEAFGSTDSGVSFFINTGGKNFFHAGDLNNWHWQDESTPEEATHSEKHYLNELNDIVAKIKQLDVAMFPVDPRIGTGFARGAEQFITQIPTKIFVPMHFWEQPETTKIFGTYAEKRGCHFALMATPGESITI